MFTKMAGGNIGDGYVYQSDYYTMYDASGSSPAEATKTYTATADCIVILNLTLTKIAGQQWRNRYREQTYGHGERGGEAECMERVTWKLTLPYVN